MVHPSVATTQVATKTPVPWDVLPAIEMAKRDPRPDRAPCLPLVPASHPEEPSGESIAQHFLASDNKNVLPIRFGPHNLIYWIPVCSILYCRCEHPASRGGDPGFGPFTCVPASASPGRPVAPPAYTASCHQGGPGQPERGMELVLPGVQTPVFPAQCQRGVSWGNCVCKASPCPRGRPRHRRVPFRGALSSWGGEPPSVLQ